MRCPSLFTSLTCNTCSRGVFFVLYPSVRRCVSTQEYQAGVGAGRFPWRPGCPAPCGRCPQHVCFHFASGARRPPCRHHRSSPPTGRKMEWWCVRCVMPDNLLACLLNVTLPCRHHGGQQCCQSPCRCHWACLQLPWEYCTGTQWWTRLCRWNTLSLPHTARAPPLQSPSDFSPLGYRERKTEGKGWCKFQNVFVLLRSFLQV